MHKKASNLFSEWALALRRSIGEPPPSSPTEVVATAAAACEPTSPLPATTTPPSPTPTRAPTAAPATSPPPPSSPAPALKKAASAASKSTGEQTKRQAETAEISRQMEADSFAAGAGTKGLLAAAVAATAAAKKMSEGPKSPKYEPPDIHPELTLAQIQQQLSEQLSGQCPIAKHRKKHNSNNVNIHEDIDGGI